MMQNIVQLLRVGGRVAVFSNKKLIGNASKYVSSQRLGMTQVARQNDR